jgi:hypothetical protein
MRARRRGLLGACLAALVAISAGGCMSGGPEPESAASVMPKPEPCATTVTTRAELVKAARRPLNRGSVVCAAPGDYRTLTLEDVQHPPGQGVTLRSKQPHAAVLAGVELRDVRGLRIEGFRVTGGFDNGQEPIRDVEIVGNDIGGGESSGFILECRVTNVLIEGNRIHDVRATSEWWTGYGISVSGDPSCGVRSDLRIRHNTIERVERDGVTLGEVHGGQLVGNVIRDVDTGKADPDFHTDSLMIWANSEDLLVKDNRITDGNGIVVSGTSGLRFENNLVAGIDNWCWQNGRSGSTPAAPVDTSWINNTVYDCGSDYEGGGLGGGYAFIIDGEGPAGNMASKNLFGNFAGSATRLTGSHNLIGDGPLPAATDKRFTPRFAAGDGWRPTNLPAGYENVGYQAAPVGHLAASEAPWSWRSGSGT